MPYKFDEWDSCHYCKKLKSDDYKDNFDSLVPHRSYYCESKKDYLVNVFKGDGPTVEQLKKKCCSKFVQGRWVPDIKEVDWNITISKSFDEVKVVIRKSITSNDGQLSFDYDFKQVLTK